MRTLRSWFWKLAAMDCAGRLPIIWSITRDFLALDGVHLQQLRAEGPQLWKVLLSIRSFETLQNFGGGASALSHPGAASCGSPVPSILRRDEEFMDWDRDVGTNVRMQSAELSRSGVKKWKPRARMTL